MDWPCIESLATCWSLDCRFSPVETLTTRWVLVHWHFDLAPGPDLTHTPNMCRDPCCLRNAMALEGILKLMTASIPQRQGRRGTARTRGPTDLWHGTAWKISAQKILAQENIGTTWHDTFFSWGEGELLGNTWLNCWPTQLCFSSEF